MTNKKFPLKKAAGWLLAAVIAALNSTPQAQSLRALPEEISFICGQERSYSFMLPVEAKVEGEAAQVVNDKGETLADVAARDITLHSVESGSSVITLSILGIPVKTVNVSVYDEMVLIPGGDAIGVTLRTDGVLVVGMSPVISRTGAERSPAKDAGILPGDLITHVNGKQVTTSDDLSAEVKAACENQKSFWVSFIRDGAKKKAAVEPAYDASDSPKLGIWARDSTAGIGTVTYYDPSSGVMGALGHPITDADTGTILGVRTGSVLKAGILGVRIGQKGSPGELKGTFSSDSQPVGSLYKNTICGIFAKTGEIPASKLYPAGLPIGTRHTVRTGEATILATVDGEGVKEYACEIQQIFRQDEPSPKSMVVRITDPRLLSKTGGIVQGMSGSPIIQDGRIIGAVTHVYVGDPTRGYGVYIEWMLEAQK